MQKALVIFLVLTFGFHTANSQAFSVDELITLAYLPSKNIEHFMKKKGFMLSWSTSDSGTMKATFIERIRSGKSIEQKKRIEINVKNGLKYFTLHIPELEEYIKGKQRLIKTGFFYDTLKDVQAESSMLFQKANISITAVLEVEDSIPHYRFSLTEKSIPSTLMYAEDLLQFDSHQFLISYFGERNIKKDIYYLSETEFKKCSVLFSGTQRQAVFVWDNETYLNDLAYIILTNKLPTEGAKNNNPLSGNNEWQLKNGIHAGLALKDLLLINEVDFDIYGNKSEMAFLVKPNAFGKIDFKKTAVMLSCPQCFDNKIFNQKEVSALDVAKANLPMRVFDIVMYTSAR